MKVIYWFHVRHSLNPPSATNKGAEIQEIITLQMLEKMERLPKILSYTCSCPGANLTDGC